MHVENTAFDCVKLICLDTFKDERGLFTPVWDRHAFRDLGINSDFTLDAASVSDRKGTVRGLHFQIPPFAQEKLVRPSRGRICDVVLDIRYGSPTFGQHITHVLETSKPAVLYIPVGFAHGFCTLEDDTEVCYKLTGRYAPDYAQGILWNDSDLMIPWPVDGEAIVSAQDSRHPLLKDMPHYFDFSGQTSNDD